MKRIVGQEPADADEGARRRRVLRAAEELFKARGFRGVTMEAVARDAAVAKATLYSYFKNKDELFVAVCERMASLLRDAFLAACSAEGSAEHRIAAAILAKHRIVFCRIRSSPHAQDLFSQRDQLAGELFALSDTEMLAALTATLRLDPAYRRNAARTARAIFFGSSSIAAHAGGLAELEAELREFIGTYLRGARTGRAGAIRANTGPSSNPRP